MLLVGHGGSFTGGSAGDDRVCASCDLLLYQFLQLIIIYFSIFLKRRNQCNASSFKNSHSYLLLFHIISFIFGK